MQFGTERFRRLEATKQTVILDSISDEFANAGYRDASTNRAVKRVGISKGSLFSYFPTKETMLLAVLGRELERAKPHFFDAAQVIADHRKQDAIERLFETIDKVTLASPKCAKLYSVWAEIDPVSEFDPMLRGDFEQLSAEWMRYIREPLETMVSHSDMANQEGYKRAAARLTESLLITYAIELERVRAARDTMLLGWHRSVAMEMIQAALGL